MLIKSISIIFIFLISSQSSASYISAKSYVTLKNEPKPIKFSKEDPNTVSCKSYDFKIFNTEIRYKARADRNNGKLFCELEEKFRNINYIKPPFYEIEASDLAKRLNLSYDLESYLLQDTDLKGFNLNPTCKLFEGRVVEGSCKCNILTKVDNSAGFPKCVARKDMLKISVNTCNQSMRSAVRFIANSKIESTATEPSDFLPSSDCDKNKIIFLEKIDGKIFKDLIFVMVHQQKIFENITQLANGALNNIIYLNYYFDHSHESLKKFSHKYSSDLTDSNNLQRVLENFSLIYWFQ